MQVHIQNDGPVTIPLETPAAQKQSQQKQVTLPLYRLSFTCFVGYKSVLVL